MDDHDQSVIRYAVRSCEMIAALAFLRAKGLMISAMDADLRNLLHRVAKWREVEAIWKRMAFDYERYLLSPDKNQRMPSEIAYEVNSSAVCLYLRHLESTERRTRDTSKAQASQVAKRPTSSTKPHIARRIGLKSRAARQNARSLHLSNKHVAALNPVYLH